MKKVIILWFLSCVFFYTLYKSYIIHITNANTPTFINENIKPQISTQGKNLIELINNNNSKISTFQCIIDLKIIQENLKFSITSELAYEKPKNLRMVAKSVFGKESDIGSNNNEFWFWNKRSKPPNLYFASYENLIKTKLKTPLHPLWIMETISLENINIKDSLIVTYGKYLAVLEDRLSINGKKIIKITLVDPKKMAIIGHYLYNNMGHLLVASEIVDHYFIDGIAIPKQIEIRWFEEKLYLIWNIENPKINEKIDPTNWIMPNIPNKQELGITSLISVVK